MIACFDINYVEVVVSQKFYLIKMIFNNFNMSYCHVLFLSFILLFCDFLTIIVLGISDLPVLICYYWFDFFFISIVLGTMDSPILLCCF